MANRRKSQSESTEIVGGISKLIGSLVGTIVAFGKRITGLKIGGTAALRERITELESKLAAARLELKKVRSEKKNVKPKAEGQKTRTRRKTGKGRSVGRRQSHPASKAGVKTSIAVKTQPPKPPTAKNNSKVASTESVS
ncbi:MAG: hypothetical protein ACYSSO_14120 [Planctomycetota bacterium]|jgi:hypothetical protein